MSRADRRRAAQACASPSPWANPPRRPRWQEPQQQADHHHWLISIFAGRTHCMHGYLRGTAAEVEPATERMMGEAGKLGLQTLPLALVTRLDGDDDAITTVRNDAAKRSTEAAELLASGRHCFSCWLLRTSDADNVALLDLH
jgi:hypothetical protein